MQGKLEGSHLVSEAVEENSRQIGLLGDGLFPTMSKSQKC